MRCAVAVIRHFIRHLVLQYEDFCFDDGEVVKEVAKYLAGHDDLVPILSDIDMLKKGGCVLLSSMQCVLTELC